MLNIVIAIISLLASIIGMGIICGKEIAVFFCPISDNLIYLLIFFIITFLLIFLSFHKCDKYENIEILNRNNLGKGNKLFSCVIFITYFIFLSSMFAAYSRLFSRLLYFFYLSILFCVLLVNNKNKVLKIFNLLTIPAFILFVINYVLKYFDFGFVYKLSLGVNFVGLVKMMLYLTVNFLLVFSCLFKTKIKGKIGRFIVSFTVSLVLSGMVFLISNVITSTQLENESFPMLILANSSKLTSMIFYIVVWCGITTTFCNSLFAMLQMLKNEKESKLDSIIKMLSLLVGSGLFSLLGFDTIVEVGYMVLGFFALIYFLLILFVLPIFRKLSFKKGNSKVH